VENEMDEKEGGENLALWRLRWSKGGSSQITVRNNRKASKETRRTLHATEILSVARGQSGQCQIYWRRRNKSAAGANGMQQRTAASVSVVVAAGKTVDPPDSVVIEF
jgi:hypothetical protein